MWFTCLNITLSYSSLPRDLLYESSDDVSSLVSGLQGDTSQNDCVEPIGVSIQQAFDHFQGKTLEAKEAGKHSCVIYAGICFLCQVTFKLFSPQALKQSNNHCFTYK